MSDVSFEVSGPISFRERLAGSQAFSQLFRDGMGQQLVLEVARHRLQGRVVDPARADRTLQIEHPEDEIVYYSLGCADYEEGQSVSALQDPQGSSGSSSLRGVRSGRP